jgi:LmbE family N-acetylglucosaminyl deacetylase
MLIVLAHPDDESFGMAGTIARYVSEGHEVSLICTTNGDVGTVDPEHMEGYSSIQELRLAELDCAAQTLGLKHVLTFGYRDSGMQGSAENDHPDSLVQSDRTILIGRITKVIRDLRPHIIVTFDPYGGYGHPDHIVTQQATVSAFEAASDESMFPEQGLKTYTPQKLYFTTFDRSMLKFIVRSMPLFGIDPRKMGRNKDMDATKIVANSYPIHARIKTGKFQAIAQKARECHASQLGGLGPRGLSQLISSMFFGVEDTYMRAFPSVNGRLLERDLFQGIQADSI